MLKYYFVIQAKCLITTKQMVENKAQLFVEYNENPYIIQNRF